MSSLEQLESFDVVVIGGTPAGIAAALAAGRLGHTVALVEAHDHLGGMITSGLGKSDIESRSIVSGLFAEFSQRVRRTYVDRYGSDSRHVELCQNGYYFEPSVAECVLDRMIDEVDSITVLRGHRFEGAICEGDEVVGANIVNVHDGRRLQLTGRVFIDATYEGDLLAAAGAEYRLGRESRSRFGEPHAGVVFYDYEHHRFLPGTTHEGDDCIPAFTYRLCLTTDPANSVALDAPPTGYDRADYLGYLEDLEAGRLSAPAELIDGRGYYPEHFDTLMRALSVAELPNSKVDANINPRPLAFPFPGENVGYVEGDLATRQRICLRHRSLALGLLYFLQNDQVVPEEHRQMARRYNLPRDEFTDNGHFPWQMYIREARRLVGRYTLTEHDVARVPNCQPRGPHADSIAVSDFPIDSFPVQRIPSADRTVLEGYLGMLDPIARPYGIPYRVMLPKKVGRLIVPLAVSASHVAFSSLRMEPTWMALGQAAGMAAHLAIESSIELADVPAQTLRDRLIEQGLTVDPPDACPPTVAIRPGLISGLTSRHS
ncbi:FAD-dependent oxidoreductase [Planctomycetales bacterium ZRK34]|nr:FAD-dependent oxidoreductase [Planctomycetales bacterium ZRK34]